MTASSHPTRDTLDRFLQGGLSEGEAEEVRSHLVAAPCLACVLAAHELLAAAEEDLGELLHSFQNLILARRLGGPVSEEESDEAIAGALRIGERLLAVHEAEHTLAPALLAELETRPPAARRAAVGAGRRFRLYGLAEHLAEASREEAHRDPARCLELAELAVEVAEALDPHVYFAGAGADLVAYAYACLGNARRIAGDLRGSERAFRGAGRLLGPDQALVPEMPEVRSLLGSLRIDQCRYLEAREVLGRARHDFRELGDPVGEARVLMQMATVEGYDGLPEAEITILEQVLSLVEAAGEERFVAWAQHNLAYSLVDAGEPLEALARFQKNRALFAEHFRDPALQLRVRWLEGRIYAGLGDLELARAALEQVRLEAFERELPYELAMVSLELAIVYLREGEMAQVQDLAEELTLVFTSQELHRHALGALYLFRQAARAQTASVGLLQEMLRYLRRSRNNPHARFDPSARWG